MNFLQNLPTLRVSSVPKTCQLYMYLPSPTPINFTHIFRLQHPEPMPRLPLVRQPYAGALSSAWRCQQLSALTGQAWAFVHCMTSSFSFLPFMHHRQINHSHPDQQNQNSHHCPQSLTDLFILRIIHPSLHNTVTRSRRNQ